MNNNDLINADYPMPDPSWDYLETWHNSQVAAAELQKLLQYMATLGNATPEADTRIKSELGSIGQRLNCARRLLENKDRFSITLFSPTFNLPFNLVELVRGADGQEFLIDALEKEIFMSLPSEQQSILNKFHYVHEQCVLDILDILKSLSLCEKNTADVWLLTDKGLQVMREIEELTSESRTMRELKE